MLSTSNKLAIKHETAKYLASIKNMKTVLVKARSAWKVGKRYTAVLGSVPTLDLYAAF